MSIENRMNTPFRPQQAWPEQCSPVETSSKKEKESAINEKESGKKMPDWGLPRRKADRSEETNVRNIGIKLFKKVDEDEMNIENICEEFIERDTLNNKVKRNLVF